MEIYSGTAICPGIAIGKLRYYSRGEYRARQYLVSNVRKEIQDFEEAAAKVASHLEQMKQMLGEENPPLARALERQRMLLAGKSYGNAIRNLITVQKVSASYAVQTTRDELAASFSRLQDSAAMNRISDVKEVTGYLIEALGGVKERIDLGDEPFILVAEAVSLNELMQMEQEKLLGIITNEGSDISHAAILSKSMEIPYLADIAPSREWDGQTAIVDGFSGQIYISPDDEELKEYTARRNASAREREELLALREEEDCTLGGRIIPLYANIGNLNDLGSVEYYGAKGIGLLRSEFQYLGREEYPGEDELFFEYRHVAQAMREKKVVIRTADLGAEKQVSYLRLPPETNPIMGNRGIRLSLERKEIFLTQLCAIYRASVYGNFSLLFPMITSLEEVDEVEGLLAQAKRRLDERQLPYQELRKGIMVETPAAVMIASELAERVDFLSLGTNDLTQYTLAMDRQNPHVRQWYNSRHPAVLRMIRMVAEAAHAHGKLVTICGELASDTDLIPEFLEMKIDALSVVPASILSVRKAIRETK